MRERARRVRWPTARQCSSYGASCKTLRCNARPVMGYSPFAMQANLSVDCDDVSFLLQMGLRAFWNCPERIQISWVGPSLILISWVDPLCIGVVHCFKGVVTFGYETSVSDSQRFGVVLSDNTIFLLVAYIVSETDSWANWLLCRHCFNMQS